MPDPKYTKPWHGVPREQIHWNPTVIEEAYIGCGTCVTGCNRLVYRYDFEHRKAKVADPLNCMVGCATFRPNPITGVVVTAADESASAPHCCAIEREPD